jgi:hypothetical protein
MPGKLTLGSILSNPYEERRTKSNDILAILPLPGKLGPGAA